MHTLLKQISANASEPATEDQASDHTPQTSPKRQEFDLEVTEAPPTPDQLKSILEYVGAQKASTIIKGARDEADAIKKLKENSENFQRPIVCSTVPEDSDGRLTLNRLLIGRTDEWLRVPMSRRS